MRHLLLLLAATSALADHAAWTHLQKLPVTQTGLQRVELDPALLDASATALGDLRLVNPAGEERPFALLRHQYQEKPSYGAVDFKQTLVGHETKLEFRISTPRMVEGVVLITGAPSFIKAAKLEASLDGANWQTVNENALLTDQNGPFNRQINFEPRTWSHFRVTVNDKRSGPLVFTEASVRGVLPEYFLEVALPARVISRDEDGSDTVLLIDVGARNLQLGALKLLTPESVFDRSGYTSVHGIKKPLYRQQFDGHSAEDVNLHIHELSPEPVLKVTIRNGDNPPLKIDGVEMTRHALPLVFQADVPGEWRLFAGNPQASAPSYDLAKMSNQLRSALSTLVKAVPVEPNPAFRAEAALPATGAAGEVRLDTRGWHWRREITPSEKGSRIFRVVLDDHIRTHASANGSDLRVIAGDGVLVRHLMQDKGEKATARAEFVLHPDEKRPQTSRWRFTLPLAGLPVTALHLETSSTLFERQLRLFEMEEDRRTGRMVERQLGYVFWKSTPDAPVKRMRLEISQRPRGNVIMLETDNGDNPAPQLRAAFWEKKAVSLLFEADGGAQPLYLLYGNPNVAAPQYDIQLVRERFEKAAHAGTLLRDVEALTPQKASASTMSGGPWLWAALVLVVGGLLWVVARLLPKVESAS